MKKIVHFLPDNHMWGGMEVYLEHTLALIQQRKRYKVVAAVTGGGRLAKQLKEAGIEVRELPVNTTKPLLRALDCRALFSLLTILKEEKPDLVHIHKGRIEQSLIRWIGFPMVYTYHSYGGPNNLENAPNSFLRGLYACTRPLLRTLTPFLNGMLVVSQYEKERLYREGFLPETFQAEVLHNGLPTQSILDTVKDEDRLQIRRELGLSETDIHQARVVLFPCRLTPDKNASAFLRIARRVVEDSRRTNPVYFVVAGNGKQAAEFEQAFSSDPVLSKYGCYLGFRQDVPRLLKACDMTVSTSIQEGFGLRVLESLMFGKPCISYAAGGIPEVMSLPEAKDWLIPLDQEDAFVDSVINTVNSSAQVLTALAPVLKRHAHRFDIHNHVQQLEHFYFRVFEQLTQEALDREALGYGNGRLGNLEAV